jgi:hypothetical protein
MNIFFTIVFPPIEICINELLCSIFIFLLISKMNHLQSDERFLSIEITKLMILLS